MSDRPEEIGQDGLHVFPSDCDCAGCRRVRKRRGSVTERERILDEMTEDIAVAFRDDGLGGMLDSTFIDDRKLIRLAGIAANRALKVVERPLASQETHSRICTCGQSGYPENSPHSNHPHTKDCPQYSGEQ